MKHSRLILSLAIIFTGLFAVMLSQSGEVTTKTMAAGTSFRIGERLSYNVSFGKMTDAAYAEFFVVSRGKLSGRDAVELQGKFKTMNLVSAFYLLDELRTTYAAVDSGLPLYSKVVSNEGVLPKENAKNFLDNPTAYYDLLTAIYQARAQNGTGSISFQEDDKVYSALLAAVGAEKVKTDAGEYETNISTVQSTFLDEIGLKDFKINFSNDEARLPVLVRFKTAKGEFRASLASIQTILPEGQQVEPTPTLVTTPQPTPTAPIAIQTPRPQKTPTPYVENQPLSAELPFALGETLIYRVASQNQNLGTVTAQVKERKQLNGRDSLVLTAAVTASGQQKGILNVGDSIRTLVDPVSLTPDNIDIKLSGSWISYNQSVQFDQNAGFAMDNAGNRFEIPVGTHSLLSLAYAVRSFNLTPSKNPTNPVNDTRVAVFLGNKPYVLILRPTTLESIEFEGRKITTQIVSVTTGLPEYDQLAPRVWLSNDERRLPMRIVVGKYQADLISAAQVQVK